MKYVIIALLLFPLLSVSQESLEQQLDSISSKEDAKTFAKTYKKANKSKLLTFNKEKHKTRLADDLFKLSKGGKKVIKQEEKQTYYKIIDKEKTMHYRASYIYFDGSKMSLDEINKKRSKIIKQYKQGYKFDALAKMHSMDRNATRGGDSGWFPEGSLHPKFEGAIKNHNRDDIFSLDIDDGHWHYVILKTHDAKAIEEITVLKYTEATK